MGITSQYLNMMGGIDASQMLPQSPCPDVGDGFLPNFHFPTNGGRKISILIVDPDIILTDIHVYFYRYVNGVQIAYHTGINYGPMAAKNPMVPYTSFKRIVIIDPPEQYFQVVGLGAIATQVLCVGVVVSSD